jgi:hypothetical protein
MDAAEKEIVRDILIWTTLALSTIVEGLWIGPFGVPYTGFILCILFFICFTRGWDNFCSWSYDTYRPISWYVEQIENRMEISETTILEE